MQTQNSYRRTALSAVLIIFSTALPRTVAGANHYTQHNLVSDIPGVADQTDPNLVNPWGISMSPTSPFWISNNHAGNTTVYNGQGQSTPAANPLVVRIPAPPGGAQPSAPTGQVFNDTQGFLVNGKTGGVYLCNGRWHYIRLEPCCRPSQRDPTAGQFGVGGSLQGSSAGQCEWRSHAICRQLQDREY